MNSLGRRIMQILERTQLQGMSIHILNKQSLDAGFGFETISDTEVPQLVERLREVLPYFMPSVDAKTAIARIEGLVDVKRGEMNER
ncbi:MAG: hypothetical protein AB1665_01300 [Candidatus Thermoplasmatota archaeon]